MDPVFAAIKGVVELAMTPLVIWMVIYTYKYAIPRMFDEFRAQIALERAQCQRCSTALENNTRVTMLLVERLGGDVEKFQELFGQVATSESAKAS